MGSCLSGILDVPDSLVTPLCLCCGDSGILDIPTSLASLLLIGCDDSGIIFSLSCCKCEFLEGELLSFAFPKSLPSKLYLPSLFLPLLFISSVLGILGLLFARLFEPPDKPLPTPLPKLAPADAFRAVPSASFLPPCTAFLASPTPAYAPIRV